MRNLKCVQHSRSNFRSDLPLTASTWDTTSDSLVCTFGPTVSKQAIEVRRLNRSVLIDEGELIASWDAPCPIPQIEADHVVSLRYLVQRGEVCLVLAGGDIVVVRPQPLTGAEKIEIVGSVDAGITAAAWSTAEDLLAITTPANNMLLMTAEFENVANISFSIEDAKLSKHVSIGWGKSQSQFKGKRAKALRDPTMPEKTDEGVMSPHDRSQTTISWRGDGAFVAVSSTAAADRRMIRVYSQEGVLDSVSEPVDGLEAALSWRPAGNLLASVKRSEDDEAKVVFFERNGLRHGDFDLRIGKYQDKTWTHAICLNWNIDSTVLAVSFADRVQLWTMGNYHYSLKQELRLQSRSGIEPCPVSWHPEEPLSFAVFPLTSPKTDTVSMIQADLDSLSNTNSLHSLSFISDISGGTSAAPHDQGMVLVADGRLLRMTPLRLANIPPPLALHELDLPGNIVDCAVNSTNSRLAVLHDCAISLFDCSQKSCSSPEPRMTETLSLPPAGEFVPLQICFSGENEVFVLLSDLSNGNSLLYDTQRSSYTQTLSPSKMMRLCPAVDFAHVFAADDCRLSRLKTGRSMKALKTSQVSFDETKYSFPSPTPYVTVVEENELTVAFGLTTSGVLFANGRQLLRNCTSYLVTKAHLIFTTSNHLLKFVHLTDPEDMQIPSDEPETDERCRNIERGAKLVTVMPSTFSLVLQMPRGNLETIYPRALVLAGIRCSVEAREYFTAFMACRNHRVDMNILHDHAPEQFIASVEIVVDQLQRVGHIDLLLSQLREEDVSKTMYKETVPAKGTRVTDKEQGSTASATMDFSNKKQAISKVDCICEAFLTVLRSRHTTNLQNIITAHLCKSKPDIESGLSVIADLHEKDPGFVEAAVEHICFLADVNAIYETALGMYNLPLALLVAQQSQKDPREYLPYLRGLQDKLLLEKQYQIDDDLGRHSRALGHLYSLQDFEKAMKYTQKHQLYIEALSLFKYDYDRHREILRHYAEFLNGRSRYKEAAIAFESISEYSSASEAYSAVTMWRESLACASLSPSSTTSTFTDLAASLADALEEAKDHASAAAIRLDHLSDVEACVHSLCRGYHFAEAIRVIALRTRQDLLQNVLDPGLGEGFGSLTELTKECREQLGAQVPRIRELRVAKARDPLNYLDPKPTTSAAVNDIPDDISLAPSQTSTANQTFLTRYTGRGGTNSTLATGTSHKTSKNRRREERKRARGKKGTVYEEEYLVGSVGRLVDRVNRSGEDVGATVEGLCRRGMWERARALESAWSALVGMCENSVGEVFDVGKGDQSGGDTGETASVDRDGAEHYRPRGADGVLLDSLEEGWRKQNVPVVKAFASSALLR